MPSAEDIIMIDDMGISEQPKFRGLNPLGILAQPNTEIISKEAVSNNQISCAEDSGEEEGEEEMEQDYEDDSQFNEDDDENTQKKIRETLAVITVPFVSPKEPLVFSYHYKYEKYLRDNNLIDVSLYFQNSLYSQLA